jgi:POT family proton-dependent oligopeptide transporter
VLVLAGLAVTGILRIDAVRLAAGTQVFIAAVAILYFGYVLFCLDLEKQEKQRVGVIAILFIASALFWAGFEQAGSSFNLFAERYTARRLTWLQFTIPAGWFQILGPAFIIALAPAMAALWLALARRNREPSLPVKFGLGLVLLGFGFVVMAGAATFVAAGNRVWPTWLVTTYLLHTLGELCLSPVGLSSVTKLAPRRLTSQLMGTWFLATSLGNLIAGLIAGKFKADAVREMPGRYLQMVLLPVIAGVALMALARPIKKWMAGVR